MEGVYYNKLNVSFTLMAIRINNENVGAELCVKFGVVLTSGSDGLHSQSISLCCVGPLILIVT